MSHHQRGSWPLNARRVVERVRAAFLHVAPPRHRPAALSALLLAALFCLGLVGVALRQEFIPGDAFCGYGRGTLIAPGSLAESGAYLSRPNWRKRAYGASPSADGVPDEVRVYIGIMSNKLDSVTCGALESALLSGLPVNVIGYGFSGAWRNVYKYAIMRDALAGFGLRPHDVFVALDSDLLIASGVDLVRQIDRFIRLSPAGLDELDAHAIRADSGRMLAPVITSAGKNCYYKDVWPAARDCTAGFTEAMTAVGAGLRQVYGATHPTPLDYAHRFVNTGHYVARGWAMRELLEGTIKYVRTHRSRTPLGHAWDCDQSAMGILHIRLMQWELAAGMLRPSPVAGDSVAVGEADRPDKARRSPDGLRAGLLALDYRHETITPLLMTQTEFVRIADRHWQPANRGAVAAARRTGAAALALSGGKEEGHHAAEAIPESYFSLYSTADDGLPSSGNNFPVMSNQAVTLSALAAMFSATTAGGDGTVDWAEWLAGPDATALPEVVTVPAVPRGTPDFFYDGPVPVPAGATSGVTSIKMAPPIFTIQSYDPFVDVFQFPAILHAAGPGKEFQLAYLRHFTSWGVPMLFDSVPSEDPRSATSRAEAYLAEAAVRTVSHRGVVGFHDFAEVCRSNT